MTGWIEFKDHARRAINTDSGREHLQRGISTAIIYARRKLNYLYLDGKDDSSPSFLHFTVSHVRVNNFPEHLKPEDFKARVIHSDIGACRFIGLPNEKVNKTFKQPLWGQKGNFLDVRRIVRNAMQRLGGQVILRFSCAGTACFICTVAAFYMKL